MTDIFLNGEATQSTAGNVFTLLESHALTQGRYAVEIDGMIVPKSRLIDMPLHTGMKIEVVQAVGGG